MNSEKLLKTVMATNSMQLWPTRLKQVCGSIWGLAAPSTMRKGDAYRGPIIALMEKITNILAHMGALSAKTQKHQC